MNKTVKTIAILVLSALVYGCGSGAFSPVGSWKSVEDEESAQSNHGFSASGFRYEFKPGNKGVKTGKIGEMETLDEFTWKLEGEAVYLEYEVAGDIIKEIYRVTSNDKMTAMRPSFIKGELWLEKTE